MKMNDLEKILKEECEQIVRVLERHAQEETNKEAMKAYRTRAQGKLDGIIDMTIVIYAKEYANDNNTYWKKVTDLREYEDLIDTKITTIFLTWYREYLEKN